MQPQFIQRNPDELQRRRLAQEMVRRGTSSAPIRHPLQGFARLAEALSGHGQIQAMDAAKAKRSDRYAQTMQDALSAYEGTPETKEPFVPDKFDETEVIPGEGGLQSVTPAKKGSFAELARALANNPDTAQLGMQLSLQEMQNKRAAEAAENKYQRGRRDKLSDDDIKYQRDLAMSREKQKTPERIKIEAEAKAAGELAGKGETEKPPSFSEKEAIKGSQKRFNELAAATSSRQSSLSKARKFKRKIESGEMKTGSTRSALSYIPGVFTEQAQLDEEFNAFAEVAARQALKASGEIRPTDADVEGMKRAMFGIGRDEASNVTLLNDYIIQQQQDEDEYLSLGGKPSNRSINEGKIDRSPIDELVSKYAD